MIERRSVLLAAIAMPLTALAACGGGSDGGGGGVASIPTPAPTAAPTPAPAPAATPTPVATNDTAEFRRSNAAVQAQALAAYDAGFSGAGVTVGVIDSGINTNSAEFAGRISPLSADFAGSRGLQDEGGHGTAVSNILLGARNDSGIHGVAFGATLLVLRTDTPGSCASAPIGGTEGGCSHNDNAIAAALDVAITARARVVNISLGGSPPNNRLRGAIDRATAAGTIIVFSAGNEGVTSPAMAANPDSLSQIALDPIARGLVIIAGATDANGTLADFSNRAGNSAAFYLAALGKRVRAVDQTGTSYLYDGTSFSAPVVAGAVALLAQAFPSLTPAQIVALLYRSATDRGAAGVDALYGNGELNIARAFQPLGATSLAAAPVAVSLTGNATLGTAMGDAARGQLAAVVRDEFGRDFNVDLAPTLQRTATPRALASGLAHGARVFMANGARTSLAVSIDDRRAASGAERLLLSPGQAAESHVLAGAMALAVSKNLHLGIGAGRGAEGLVRAPGDSAMPAFLVADRSLDRAPMAAFAVRQRLGTLGMTFAVENGDIRLWQQGEAGPRDDRMRGYAYSEMSATLDASRGRFAFKGRLTRLDERATILGSRFGSALGGNGAVSWFADFGAGVMPFDDWRLGANVRHGWTMLGANGVRGASILTTRALSADVARRNLWVAGDNFALRYSEPLRVSGGGLDLIALGSVSQRLSLTPSGHERNWEAAYVRPLGTGWLTTNTYWRRQPGNYAAAPDDIGAALRYALNF